MTTHPQFKDIVQHAARRLDPGLARAIKHQDATKLVFGCCWLAWLVVCVQGAELPPRCLTPSPGPFQAAQAELQAQGAALPPDTLPQQVFIPVVFHVIHALNGEGNIPEEMIQRQLDVLNWAFNPHGIAFGLASVQRVGNDEWYSQPNRMDYSEGPMLATLAIDPKRFLNFYTVGHRYWLGSGSLPQFWPPGTEVFDGVMCLHSTLPGGGASSYDMGYTGVHEVGHYLGLLHTFEKGCDGPGDYVDDTPSEDGPAFGCQEGRDSCPGPGVDPIHNFMDYSEDPCMFEFTNGQAARMKSMVATYRPAFATNLPPVRHSRVIYIDRTSRSSNPDGTAAAPYPTLAHGLYAANSGDTLRLRAGDYSINQQLGGKAVRIEPQNGRVKIAYGPPIPSLLVRAGPGLVVPVGTSSQLSAAAEVIGGGAVANWRWEKLSGPGNVSALRYDEQQFMFSVSRSGTYEFRVTASTGQLSASDSVSVTFQEPILVVAAGSDQSNVPLTALAELSGLVSVDEAPNPEVTVRWRLVRKPEGQDATIQSPTTSSTTLRATGQGVYTLVFEGWHRGRYRRDIVRIGFGVALPPESEADNRDALREPFLELTTNPLGSRRLTLLSGIDSPLFLQRSTDLIHWADWMQLTPFKGRVSVALADQKQLEYFRALSIR